VDLGVRPGVEHGVLLLGNRDLVGADDGRHASGKEHARHGDDKRLDLKIAHENALHEAEHRADGEDQQDERNARLSLGAHAVGQDHAVHGDERADGNVDAARQHDAGHAAGHADESRIRDEQIEEGLEMGESLLRIDETARRVHHDEEHDGDEQQQGVAVDAALFLGIRKACCVFHLTGIPFPCSVSAALASASFRALRRDIQALNTGA